jgi:hypothetical protein
MKIGYVENKNGKLFSFSVHDYKDDEDKEGNYIMIDGGFSYNRYSGELKEDEIKNLIFDIREKFTWGQNYNEKNERLPETIYKPLKDLTTSHISGIIRYLLEKSTWNEEEQYFIQGKQIMAYLLIFTYELENRLNVEMQ